MTWNAPPRPVALRRRGPIETVLADPVRGPEIARRFWRKVQRGDGCWEWQGRRLPVGYGALTIGGVGERAHRVAWLLSGHSLRAADHLLHACDNPPCVNPEHLFVGTHRDNMADMKAKGRGARGARSGSSRLTESDVRSIRAAAAAGATQTSLARQFGVALTTVNHLVHRRTWSWLD